MRPTWPTGGPPGTPTSTATAWRCATPPDCSSRTRPPRPRRPSARRSPSTSRAGCVATSASGGIGRALLSWQLARGAELHAEREPAAPGRLEVAVAPEAMTSLEGLVRRAGLQPQRWYRAMSRPLTDLPPAAGPARDRAGGLQPGPGRRGPAGAQRGVHQAPRLQRARSGDLAVAVHRAARVPPRPVGAGRRGRRPARVRAGLRVRGGRAGPSRGAGTSGRSGCCPGPRPWAGVGDDRRAALHAAAGQDCQGASLQVDTDNVTGALRLYQKLGFTTDRTRVAWSVSQPPFTKAAAQ